MLLITVVSAGQSASSETYSEQLKQLMNYTLFHIGMYTTLCTALIALLGLSFMKKHVPKFEPFLWWTLGCFLLAGAAGGLVASTIPYHTDWGAFLVAPVGMWNHDWLPAATAMHLEHMFFWLGIAGAVAGVVRARW